MDWVFHVDTDELMYPASAAEYSLQARLSICNRSDVLMFFRAEARSNMPQHV